MQSPHLLFVTDRCRRRRSLFPSPSPLPYRLPPRFHRLDPPPRLRLRRRRCRRRSTADVVGPPFDAFPYPSLCSPSSAAFAVDAGAAPMDETYEFNTPRFFDFINPKTNGQIRAVGRWFDTALCCNPSPFTRAIKVERSMGNAGLCDFVDENDQKFVIDVDDEDVDGEGDIIMAVALVTPQALSFMIRHGSGIISVGMKEEDLEGLKIPMMSLITDIEDPSTSASTVTVLSFQFQL